jgi:quercetin dioxygenase-like cupin family protein
MAAPQLPPAEALSMDSLIAHTPAGIASRVIARSAGGNVTLFAFDAGQELSEHTAPFDALLLVQHGVFELTIGGKPVRATAGMVVRLPANVPHAVAAADQARMLLIMLKADAARSLSAIGSRLSALGAGPVARGARGGSAVRHYPR